MTSRKTFEGPYFKALDDEQGTFEAVVSVFGNVDYQGDRVMPGAFEEHLKQLRSKGAKLPVVWSHDWGNPFAHIGYVDPQDAMELTTETAKSKGFGDILGGLYVKGKLDIDKEFARQVYDLLKDGRVREWSFAYDVVDEKTAKDGANELNVLNVWEVGPTLKGANNATTTIAVKGIKQQLEVAHEIDMGTTLVKEAFELSPEVGLKFISDFTAKQRERLNGEKAADDEAEAEQTTEEIADTFKGLKWDGDAAMGKCKSAGDYRSIAFEKENDSDPDTAAHWCLPHHSSPHGPADKGGVAAAKGRLNQTGPTVMSKEAIQAHLDRHDSGKAYDDDMVIYVFDEKAGFKPWHIAERDGKYCVIKDSDGTTEKCHDTRDEAVAHMRALYANEPKADESANTSTAATITFTNTMSTEPDEDKAGRRISKDSEQAIRDAIASLQSLLELPDEETPKSDEPETTSEEAAQKAAAEEEIAHYKAIIDSLKMDETN